MKNMEIEDFLNKRNILEKQVKLLFKTISNFYESGAFENNAWYTIETLLSSYITMMNTYIKSNNLSDDVKKKILNDLYYQLKRILDV